MEPLITTELPKELASQAEDTARSFGPKITAFLAAIRMRPNITQAAELAKVNKAQHYAKLKSSPAYAETFRQAWEIGWDAVSDVAVSRSIDGYEEPMTIRGKIVEQEDTDTGTMVPVMVRKYDHQLLRFILKHRHSEYRPHVEESGDDELQETMRLLQGGREYASQKKTERDEKSKENLVA